MEDELGALSREVRDLSLGRDVERVQGPLSPLRFLRDFVMPGKPCIVTGAIDHWAALSLWSNRYLCDMLQDEPISVHFTPDGRADALVEPREMQSLYGCTLDAGLADMTAVFVTACVQKMPFGEALQSILRSQLGEVAYAQQQNDCFRSEYKSLWDDADLHIPWATEALGSMPEAVNLWIGNDKSSTSFHKDHYENLYAVVSGVKHFTLLPPVDVHRLYIREYPSATYSRSSSGESSRFTIVNEGHTVPWVSVDPYPDPSKLEQARRSFPRYFQLDDKEAAFECTIRAGEILYLPSMWFHHVRQEPDAEGRTIALNFWYDMQFDMKFAYFNFLQSCCGALW